MNGFIKDFDLLVMEPEEAEEDERGDFVVKDFGRVKDADMLLILLDVFTEGEEEDRDRGEIFVKLLIL